MQKVGTEELLLNSLWGSRNSDSLLSGLLFLVADLTALTASLEDLIEVVLTPSDVRVQTGELPFTINLLVPMLVCAVCVSLHEDSGSCLISVSLVRHTELMPSDDLVVRNLLEF